MLRDLRRIARLLAGDMPMRRASLRESMADYWRERQRVDATMARRRARIARRMEAVAREIEDGSTVLEVGCGAGDLLEVLRRRRPGCRLLGIDVSAEAVAAARAKGFEVRRLDIMDLDPSDFPDVDYVVASEVLEHLPDPETALLRCGRVARRRIVVTVPNVAFLLHRLRLGLFGKFPVTTVFHIREHLSLWSVSDFRYWARALGFRVVKVEGLGGVEALGLNEAWPNLLAAQALYVLEPAGELAGASRVSGAGSARPTLPRGAGEPGR